MANSVPMARLGHKAVHDHDHVYVHDHDHEHVVVDVNVGVVVIVNVAGFQNPRFRSLFPKDLQRVFTDGAFVVFLSDGVDTEIKKDISQQYEVAC